METSSHQQVLLVDIHDNPIGTAEKLQAHQQGLRHRAFSVFIFDKQTKDHKLLIQQRSAMKYHCPNLWTNTCCSHPSPNSDQSIKALAEQRLYQEVGLRDCTLEKAGVFHYYVILNNGLIENEIDHVFIGFVKEQSLPFNHQEVSQIAWVPINQLKSKAFLKTHPITPWFLQALTIAEKAL